MSLKKIATKKAATKKTVKRATSVATIKLGSEPTFICEPTTAELVRALNWYNVCWEDPEQHKAEVTIFLQHRGWNNDDIRVVTAKIKKLVPTNIFLARMFNRNVPIDIGYDAQALNYFESVLKKQTDDELDADGNPVIKAMPLKTNKALPALVNYIEERIEELLKAGEPVSLYQWLQAEGVNASTAAQLRTAFKFKTLEFEELASGDKELVEAYHWLAPRRRRIMAQFMEQLNKDLDAFIKVKKATRVVRKKKPVKADKIVKYIKYKKSDDTYKVASFSPEKIHGAKVVWLFNTKNRMLSYYDAGEGTLSAKGAAIIGFTTSGAKKLRKPETQLGDFTSGTVKALPRKFEALKTTTVENYSPRPTADTILLRVFT